MLLALAAAAVLLLALGLAASAFQLPEQAVQLGAAALAGLGLCTAVAACIVGGSSVLAIPTLPVALSLALDPLSALFVLLILLGGIAAALVGDEGRTARLMPVLLCAMTLTVLAGDGFTLVLGLALMAGAGWALADAEPAWSGLAAFGAVCLLGAFALLGPEPGFAALRAAPADGWRSAAAFGLALLGTGPLLLLGGQHAAKVALYIAIRILFDLCGPANPFWWCVPLLAAGSAAVVFGALRANAGRDLRAIAAAAEAGVMGTCFVGLGVALAARSADLVPLAALALAAALLQALTHSIAGALLRSVDGSVMRGAGTRQLDRLGGLVHSMPVTTACALAGAASLAAMPLTAGFASEWLLLQSVFMAPQTGAPQTGGLAWQVGFAVVAGCLALGMALTAAAMLRIAAVAFLGRPRSPRAAAAEDAPRRVRTVLVALAVLGSVVGLVPGAAIKLFGPALRMLATVSVASNWSGIAAQGDAPGYGVIGIAVLLAFAGGLGVVVHRWAISGVRHVPAWDGGFAAPPPWLPFGDPATQPSSAGFSQPLLQGLGGLETLARALQLIARRLAGLHVAALPTMTVRRALAVVLAALLALLAAIAWLETA